MLSSELLNKENLVTTLRTDLESYKSEMSSNTELQKKYQQLIDQNRGLEVELTHSRNLKQELTDKAGEMKELENKLKLSREEKKVLETRVKSTEAVLR